MKKNKVPIICGGTGFYIDTLINNTIFPEVPPNKKLREELSNKTAQELFDILKKLDKNRAENIDSKNKVRLIRAIEIAKTLGKVPLLKNATFSAPAENVALQESSKSKYTTLNGCTSRTCATHFKFLKIGLALSDEILKERIKARLLSRIKKGMIKEVKNLHEKEKISWKRLESFGLEYRYVSYYLEKSKNLSPLDLRQAKEDMIEKLNTEIWHFAKRQKTWFKRDKDILWINPLKKEDKQKALREIRNFLE